MGCTSSKKVVQKRADTAFSSNFYENQFTGFVVFDPEKKDTLYNFNGKKYFTPASNTKVFTLFASLQLLPDTIPSLRYIVDNDTTFVEGTGDPTLLHTYFQDSTALKFMERQKNIALYLNNFHDNILGPGWSWDDYQYYYQVEKNSFPMYGNVTTISASNPLQVIPNYFQDSVIRINFTKYREEERNAFYFGPSRKDTLEIPFKTDTTLTRKLLEGVLGKKVKIAMKMPEGEKRTLYSIPSDSVYVRMMHESDNFLAEQLLVLASSRLTDTLDGRKAMEHLLENQLADLKQPPRWVDGSGLSRYNLFSPESMVHVLHQMYSEIPRKRLLRFFPAGGVSGTLEEWYFGDPEPYVYAKTGSLGNNHNLSGYLLTKSGKTLIFSFMNNHFRHPSSEVKKRMQLVLESIRESY